MTVCGTKNRNPKSLSLEYSTKYMDKWIQTNDIEVEKLINIFENELIKELDRKNTSR
jgi:hypothetical protein